MPCSCGNTSCPCGIPCYCLEESCKCLDCAIALHRLCKICDKPLITDIQTEDTCSCFVGESTALILENEDNPQCQMGNIPMPVGYFVSGKLIVNVMIPDLRLPQFLPQRSISSMPPSLSIQTDSRKIMPSFISNTDVVTPLPSENSAIPSPSESYQLLKKSRREANYCTPSDICSIDATNADVSCKETCPSFVLQSTDEKETENKVQNTKSETEGNAIEQEPSTFYLPSIRIGDVSYPVELTDPVWRLPNRTCCFVGKSEPNLKLCNPFYVTGPVQTINTSDQKCHQQTLNLNFNSNGLAQDNNVTNLKINEQPLYSTTDQPDLEMYGKRAEFEAPLAFSAGNKFSAFSLSGNSKATALREPLSEILANYSMSDQKITAPSLETSSSGIQSQTGVHSQKVNATSESETNDCFLYDTAGYNGANSNSTSDKTQYNNFLNFKPTPFLPKYFEASNTTSKLQPLFKMHGNQSFEENENPQNCNSNPGLASSKRNKEKDSVSFFINTSTTLMMEKLLKPSKRLSACSTFDNVVSPTQNSDSNPF